jgi:hypothetical protein
MSCYPEKVFNSTQLSDAERRSGRFILVPGFGANFGVLGSDLGRLVSEQAQSIQISIYKYEQDIEWLLEEKVISRT